MTFEELRKMVHEARKVNPTFGGTYEIHYTDPQMGKMVAYVEAYSSNKNGVRKAAIKKAVEEQNIPEDQITMVKKFD